LGKKSYPEKRFYLIDAERSGEIHEPLPDSILQVRKFRISTAFENKGFVYRKEDQLYQSDYYHNFFIAPAGILTEQTMRWLDQSRLFQHVVDSSSHLTGQYILEGRVAALYGDYRNKKYPKAAMEIQFFLLRDDPSQTQVVFQRNVRRDMPIDTAAPEALVVGWNSALSGILEELEQILIANFPPAE